MRAQAAIIGFVFLSIPLVFIVGEVLESAFGIDFVSDVTHALLANRMQDFNLVSPFLFLGLLACAAWLNLRALMGVRFDTNARSLTISLKRGSVWNVAALGISLLITAVILAYGAKYKVACLIA